MGDTSLLLQHSESADPVWLLMLICKLRYVHINIWNSSLNICTCMQFHEKEFVLRTRETHAFHCSSLDGPIHEHIATTFGVICDSTLNSSCFFHVVDGIVPDIMHDILEGTLQLHLKWLLSSQILEEKMYSLRTLNDRIQSFSYGPADSPNRPTPISHDTLSTTKRNNVKQSCKSIIVHNNHGHGCMHCC